MTRIHLAALCALGILASCTGRNNEPAEGSERGPCRDDGSCDEGLVCASDICVSVPSSSSSSGGLDGGQSDGAASSSSGGSDAGTRVDGSVVLPPIEAQPACSVQSVNGAPPQSPLRLQPFQTVVLTAAGAASPGGEITSWSWSLERIPAGSRVWLTSRSVQTTSLNTPDAIGLDLPGYYIIKLDVADASGTHAITRCSLDVRPIEGLAIVATWDLRDTDMDLHLLKKDSTGKFCAASGGSIMPPAGSLMQQCPSTDAPACNYTNCKVTSPERVNWDGPDGGFGGPGDPTLLIDDVNGHGPEVITVPAPVDGDYLVGMHYFSSHSQTIPAVAAVRVYLAGQLRAYFTSALNDGAWWEPALIHIENGQLCVQAPGDTTATCLPAPTCTPGVDCVQCNDDTGCGPGTECNVPTHQCEPSFAACLVDSDCPGHLACSLASSACLVGDCSQSIPCPNASQTCSTENLTCVLGPPVCTETDEPNDTRETARAITAADGGVLAVEGTLCRDNIDYLSFPVTAGKRVRVVVASNSTTPPPPGPAAPIVIEMFLPGSDTPAATRQFFISGPGPYVTLAANTDTSGTGYVRLTMPFVEPLDQIPYSVTVTTVDAIHCDTEPGEPNDTLVEASASVLDVDVPATRMICEPTDIDHHTFHASANKRVTFAITTETETFFSVSVLDTSGALLADLTAGPGSANTLALSTTAAQDLILVVEDRFPSVEGFEPIAYTVTVTETDRPTCNDTAYEPNDTQETAARIYAGTLDAVICQRPEHDWYRFSLTSASSIDLTLSMPAGIDLDVTLLNAAGFVASGASTANPENVHVATAAAGPYWLDVRAYTPDEERFPVGYRLTITAPGAEQPPSSSSSGAGSSSLGTSSGAAASSSGPASSSSAASSSSPASSASAGSSSLPGSSSTASGASASSSTFAGDSGLGSSSSAGASVSQ